MMDTGGQQATLRTSSRTLSMDPLFEFERREAGYVYSCCHMDPSTLACACSSECVTLWDLGKLDYIGTCSSFVSPVQCLASPLADGSVMLAGSGHPEFSVRILRKEADAEEYTVSAVSGVHRGGVNSLCPISESLVASCSSDCSLHFLDISTLSGDRVSSAHEAAIYTMEFSLEPHLLVTGSNNKICKLWNSHSHNCVRTITTPHSLGIRSVHVVSDPESDFLLPYTSTTNPYQLITTSYDQSICVFDLRQTREDRHGTAIPLLQLRGHENVVYCACSAIGGRYVISGSSDQTLRVWDLWKEEEEEEEGREINRFVAHDGWVRSVCVLSSLDYYYCSPILISTGYDMRTRGWEMENVIGEIIESSVTLPEGLGEEELADDQTKRIRAVGLRCCTGMIRVICPNGIETDLQCPLTAFREEEEEEGELCLTLNCPWNDFDVDEDQFLRLLFGCSSSSSIKSKHFLDYWWLMDRLKLGKRQLVSYLRRLLDDDDLFLIFRDFCEKMWEQEDKEEEEGEEGEGEGEGEGKGSFCSHSPMLFDEISAMIRSVASRSEVFHHRITAMESEHGSEILERNSTITLPEEETLKAGIDFESLWKDQLSTNRILEARDGVQFHVHEEVLIARSNFFHLMWGFAGPETLSSVVKVERLSSSQLQTLLEFVYTNAIQSDDLLLLFTLLQHAEMYFSTELSCALVRRIREVSVSVILLDPESFLEAAYSFGHYLEQLPARYLEAFAEFWMSFDGVEQEALFRAVRKSRRWRVVVEMEQKVKSHEARIIALEALVRQLVDGQLD